MNRRALALACFVVALGCSKKTPEDLCAHEHDIVVKEASKSTVKITDDPKACRALMTAMQDKAPVTYKCMSRCIPSANDMVTLLACEFKCGKEGRDAGEKLAEIEKDSKPKPEYDPSENDVTIQFGDEKMKVRDAFAAPVLDEEEAKDGWYVVTIADTLEPEACEGVHIAKESKRSVRFYVQAKKGKQTPQGLHSLGFEEKTGKSSAHSWVCNEVDKGSIELLELPKPGKNGRVRLSCTGPKDHSIDGEVVFRTCGADS